MVACIKILGTTFLCYILLQSSASGDPIKASCFRSKLKALLLDAMPHVKELQHKYELEGNRPNCRQVFPLKKYPGCNLKGMERLPLSIYRISLTVQVLEQMSMDPLVRKNLETFNVIQNELSKCEITKSPEGEICQEHLTKYAKKVSPECLQDDILLHLIWTLCEDVGLLLTGENHRDEGHKGPVTPKFQSSRKLNRRRKNRRRKAKKRQHSQLL